MGFNSGFKELSVDGVDVGRCGDLDRIPLAQDMKE